MRISDWSSDVCSSDLLIQSDVTAIRSDVSDLHEMAQPHMIIKRPASAADHFNNAWLYHTMQRNPAKAREEIRALYARHAPRKMDAAQLYLDAGSAVTGRAQLVEERDRKSTRLNASHKWAPRKTACAGK